jgi:hypothetical protein
MAAEGDRARQERAGARQVDQFEDLRHVRRAQRDSLGVGLEEGARGEELKPRMVLDHRPAVRNDGGPKGEMSAG